MRKYEKVVFVAQEVRCPAAMRKVPGSSPGSAIGPCTHVYGTQPTVYIVRSLCAR